MSGVFVTTLCDKVCQLHATGWWFSPDTPVSSTNKTDRHDITEILLKLALSTITPNHSIDFKYALSLCRVYTSQNNYVSYGIRGNNIHLCFISLESSYKRDRD